MDNFLSKSALTSALTSTKRARRGTNLTEVFCTLRMNARQFLMQKRCCARVKRCQCFHTCSAENSYGVWPKISALWSATMAWRAHISPYRLDKIDMISLVTLTYSFYCSLNQMSSDLYPSIPPMASRNICRKYG